uniref:Uncharacterized protein n=1 Tax=Panagrolaimus sp. PS1159 TaxID=55785 RepID=A0AC35F779_9BILA
MLFIIFTQINFAVLIFNGCAKKKKESEPQKLPKCSMKVKSASASGKDKKNNKESPANTPKSDENKTAGSPKGKSTILITWKSSKEGIKGGDGKKVPAKAAIITQVKDAEKTDRKDDEGGGGDDEGGGGGGKGKLVSNPIVSAATEPFPTMVQPVKEQQITTEQTQSAEQIHTDKTQKDS